MRYGFIIDNRKCIGCHACTVACKTENHVPLTVNRTWVKYVEKGTFPNTRRVFQVTRCNHCENPPCVTICPVTAMYQRKDGIVDFSSERCIGCKACMQACPYDSIYIDPDEGTAAKCHFCAHRTEVGLEPSCVVVCPEHAIIAGDLDAGQAKRPTESLGQRCPRLDLERARRAVDVERDRSRVRTHELHAVLGGLHHHYVRIEFAVHTMATVTTRPTLRFIIP